MKRLFGPAFAAIALFARVALSMPSPSLATTSGPAFTTATHTEKIVPVAHVIAATASHDLAVPMSSGSSISAGSTFSIASLPGVQMKPGRLARILPIPWRS